MASSVPRPVRRRLLLAALLALPCWSLAASRARPQDPSDGSRPVVVVVVRHAEKAQDGGDDPPLSAAGEARAERLARLLGASGVTHLFASEYRRTAATLAPLAQARGLEVAERPAREGERLLAELRALPAGSVAVVAGHSNTVPALVRALCGAGPEGLRDDEYESVFAVTLARGCAPALLELRLE